jgi:4-amino-4-deoxy-L-arabinose transferase-like glycosyltransferase
MTSGKQRAVTSEDDVFQPHRIIIALFFLCAGLRVYECFVTFVIARDSVLYLAMAEAFRAGRVTDALRFITPPFYPILIALTELVTENPELAGKMVSALMGICVFLPVYLLGRRIFEQKIVLVSLAFLALHPYLVRYSAEALSESTFIFLGVAGFWLLWQAIREGRIWYAAAATLMLGFACLTRGQGLIWLGTLLLVPVVFALLPGIPVDFRKRTWVYSLLCIGFFLLVIAPYVVYLKVVTGEWTVRQGASVAIATKTPYSSAAGLLATITSLLADPWSLIKKLGLNLGHAAVLLPKTFHYPLFLLLIVGLVRAVRRRLSPGEVYLGIICTTYILAHALLYMKVRYLLPVVPFALYWMAEGFWAVVSWGQGVCERRWSAGAARLGRGRVVVTLLLVVVAVSTLPKTLQPQRFEKLDRKIVGQRIAALSEGPPRVVASDPRVTFYARGELVRFPKVSTVDDLVEYALRMDVDIIVMNQKRTEETRRIGKLTRDFFEGSDVPAMELLFVYPENAQGDVSQFYVYRLNKNEEANKRGDGEVL